MTFKWVFVIFLEKVINRHRRLHHYIQRPIKEFRRTLSIFLGPMKTGLFRWWPEFGGFDGHNNYYWSRALFVLKYPLSAIAKTRDVEPMFVWNWTNVCDAGPTLKQHGVIFASLTFLCYLDGSWSCLTLNLTHPLAGLYFTWSMEQRWDYVTRVDQYLKAAILSLLIWAICRLTGRARHAGT